MKAYFKPSMTLTESTILYVQAETKGLISAARKVVFGVCDVDPIKLAEPKHQMTLAREAGLKSFELSSLIVNTCEESCSTESYML